MQLLYTQRAWVIQERILARRTLFFGSSMVSWECLEEPSSEFPQAFFPYNTKTLRGNASRVRAAFIASPFAQEISWG
jgi:hypothetical protein